MIFSILSKMNPQPGFVDLVVIRCYECHAVLSDKQLTYENLLINGNDPRTALDHLGLYRYCCREKFINPKRYIDQIYKRDIPTSQTWREPGKLPIQTSDNNYKENFIPSFNSKMRTEMDEENIDLSVINKLEQQFKSAVGRSIKVNQEEKFKDETKIIDVDLPF